jgi:hypothetical protein
MLTLREETKRLTALSVPGFVPLTAIAAADAILFESAAPTNGAAVAVLKLCIAGAVGIQTDLNRIRKRLEFIKTGLHAMAGFSMKRFSP